MLVLNVKELILKPNSQIVRATWCRPDQLECGSSVSDYLQNQPFAKILCQMLIKLAIWQLPSLLSVECSPSQNYKKFHKQLFVFMSMMIMLVGGTTDQLKTLTSGNCQLQQWPNELHKKGCLGLQHLLCCHWCQNRSELVRVDQRHLRSFPEVVYLSVQNARGPVGLQRNEHIVLEIIIIVVLLCKFKFDFQGLFYLNCHPYKNTIN